MNIDQKTRNETFQKASKVQVTLYSDPDSGPLLKNIANQHSDTITDYAAFAIAIGDVILGLVPQENCPTC